MQTIHADGYKTLAGFFFHYGSTKKGGLINTIFIYNLQDFYFCNTFVKQIVMSKISISF